MSNEKIVHVDFRNHKLKQLLADTFHDDDVEVCTGFRTIKLTEEPGRGLRILEVCEFRWVHCAEPHRHDGIEQQRSKRLREFERIYILRKRERRKDDEYIKENCL
jgi:hypothetical protein